MCIKWRVKRSQSWDVALKGKHTEKEHFGIKAVCPGCKASLHSSTTSSVKYLTLTNAFWYHFLGGVGRMKCWFLLQASLAQARIARSLSWAPAYIWDHLFIWWRKPFPISLCLCLDIGFFWPICFPQFLIPDTLLPQFPYRPTRTPSQ